MQTFSNLNKFINNLLTLQILLPLNLRLFIFNGFPLSFFFKLFQLLSHYSGSLFYQQTTLPSFLSWCHYLIMQGNKESKFLIEFPQSIVVSETRILDNIVLNVFHRINISKLQVNQLLQAFLLMIQVHNWMRESLQCTFNRLNPIEFLLLNGI